MKETKKIGDSESFTKILTELRLIRCELEKLDKRIEVMEKDCNKMTGHVDFVENIYEQVKRPFHYIVNKVGTVMKLEDE